MIANPSRYSPALLIAVLAASAFAWSGTRAQDAVQATGQTAAPDWSALDAQVEVGIKAYKSGDDVRAKEILLPLAEQGHPKAMNIIGLMHDGTDVFPNDPKLECDWYEKSAKAGFASGMYNLSICFNHGGGRPKDPDQMLSWRNKAAEHGSPNAMVNLASMDKTRGEIYLYWMTRAADHGSRYALVDLWFSGHKDVALQHGMVFDDLACVLWRVFVLDKPFTACD